MKILILLYIFCSLPAAADVFEFDDIGRSSSYIAKDYIVRSRASIPSYSRMPSKYIHIIKKAAKRFHIDESLITEVIRQESAFRPCVKSHKGATGLMQLMPDTAKRFNVSNSCDPFQNIMGGSQYLSWLMKRYNNNVSLVLAAYNAGEGAVDKYNGIPPYKETENYVLRIMRRLGYYT